MADDTSGQRYRPCGRDCVSDEDKYYIVMPGPPREMKPMFTDKSNLGCSSMYLRRSHEMPLYSRMLKFAENSVNLLGGSS